LDQKEGGNGVYSNKSKVLILNDTGRECYYMDKEEVQGSKDRVCVRKYVNGDLGVGVSGGGMGGAGKDDGGREGGKVAEQVGPAGEQDEPVVRKGGRKRNDKPRDGNKLFVSALDGGGLEDTGRKDCD
jgi:hypothetical protein